MGIEFSKSNILWRIKFIIRPATCFCIHAENSIYFVLLIFVEIYLLSNSIQKAFLEFVLEKENRKEKKKRNPSRTFPPLTPRPSLSLACLLPHPGPLARPTRRPGRPARTPSFFLPPTAWPHASASSLTFPSSSPRRDARREVSLPDVEPEPRISCPFCEIESYKVPPSKATVPFASNTQESNPRRHEPNLAEAASILLRGERSILLPNANRTPR